MAASRLSAVLVLSLASAWATAQDSPSAGTSDPQQSESSSSKKTHGGTVRHSRVLEEDAKNPELAQAEDFIQKQNYGAAEPLLRRVVEADSSNYVAWFDLGFVENAIGNIESSIAAYRKSVAAKPDVFESNLNLGLQLAKTNQPDAEQFLRAATKLQPTSHPSEGLKRAWLSLGHVLEAKQPEQAIAAYRDASALQPKDAEPHVAAGALFEKQGKFADAEQEYKAALAVDATSDALTGLANIYMQGRRFPEAAESLRKLVALHPEQAAAHVQLGRVLAAEGRNEEAIAEMEAGARLAPSDLSVQRDLADLYTMTGNNEKAEAAYRALLATHANDPELHAGLGRSLLRQKKFPQAQDELLEALKLKPNLAEAYGDLAFVASENKNFPLVLKALELRAQSLPENANTYFLRASAFDHLKNFKQAAANYHLFLNAANGKYPDQEWQAKHRLIAIEPKK